MYRKLFFGIIIILFFYLISSCGESFLLSNGDEEENIIQILSLEKGGIIEKGETLIFKVISGEEEENPDKLEINLYNGFGDRIGRLENTSFALNEELSLDLFDSLITGEYTLEFILYLETEVLFEENITFFYTAEEFVISGIESFPPVVFPGATVLLTAAVSAPDDSDSFLRWTVDEKVITRGLLSDGTDKILWSVPEEEGVYSVKVELFPASPDNADDFPFSSEIFMDVELYVSESSKPPSRYLYPEESYYALYHFDGNLMDTAKGRYTGESDENRMEAVPIGEPQLITVQEDFGYYIDKYSGFRIEECILPNINGEIKPFTISIGLELDPAQQEKEILVCKTFDNLFTLTIYIDSESYIYASIQSGSKEIIIPSSINTFAVEYRFLISLSIVPAEFSEELSQDDSLLAMWFLDGIQTNVLTFEDMELEISSDGETIVGGENGFAGVIDELGVYFIDEKERYTINPGLYENAIQRVYGEKSVFAEGFDGIYNPDSLIIEGEDRVEKGRFLLESTLSVAFTSINPEEEEITIVIGFDSPLPKQGLISLFWNSESSPFLSVSLTGEFIVPQIEPTVIEDEEGVKKEVPVILNNIDNSFYVKIINRSKKVSFPGEEIKNVNIKPPIEEPGEILLKISNTADSPIIINSITVVKD